MNDETKNEITDKQMLIGAGIAIFLLITLSLTWGYLRYGNWGFTGLIPYEVKLSSGEFIRYEGKTLWDWLDLLIVPIMLAIGGFLLNRSQLKNNRRIEDERRQDDKDLAKKQREIDLEIAKISEEEKTLLSFFDVMKELLLDKDLDLRHSKEGSEVRSVARARVLAALRGVSGIRKTSIIHFLLESNLIGGSIQQTLYRANLYQAEDNETGTSVSHNILSLLRADLQLVNLYRANLYQADLRGVDLRRADLRKANLQSANLRNADLRGADLRGADLQEANLLGTRLQGAKYNSEPITYGSSFFRQTKWPEGFDLSDPKAAGAIDVSKQNEESTESN